MKTVKTTTATLLIALFMISIMTLTVPAMANTVESSTMHFEGALTDEGGGVYTGVIDMTAGEYYVPGGPGAGIYTGGGFDLYAKEGGTAYVEGLDPDTYIIGSDHDAYSQAGPWGGWYDPDCADWDQYELELTADHWYLRYEATDESPMSGIMMWRGDGTGYAAETDPGTVKSDHGGTSVDPTEYTAGSVQEWGWWCGWGEERIPLEYLGFEVVVESGSSYHVTLTPAPSEVVMTANVRQPIISIKVEPAFVDFGTIIAGKSSERTVTVVNLGETDELITVQLLHDSYEFYKTCLRVDGHVWDYAGWSITIAQGYADTADLVLVVPKGYASDAYEGTLVFWAEEA